MKLLEKRVNERLTQKRSKPRRGTTAGAMTKAEIMAVRSTSGGTCQKLIAENLELFRKG